MFLLIRLLPKLIVLSVVAAGLYGVNLLFEDYYTKNLRKEIETGYNINSVQTMPYGYRVEVEDESITNCLEDLSCDIFDSSVTGTNTETHVGAFGLYYKL
ncbi:MAG: hypothetical protein AAF413_00250 [Patescibacteria group bacterium]